MNLTQDETLAMYDALNHIRAEKERKRRLQQAQEDEEQSLYGGSTDKIAPNW